MHGAFTARSGWAGTKEDLAHSRGSRGLVSTATEAVILASRSIGPVGPSWGGGHGAPVIVQEGL